MRYLTTQQNNGMRETPLVMQVLAALYEHPDNFFYACDVLDALGTPGETGRKAVRRVLYRLLDNGYVVHMIKNAERPKGVQKNQKCYRITKEGKKLVLKHKLTHFRAYKTRRYVMYPREFFSL